MPRDHWKRENDKIRIRRLGSQPKDYEGPRTIEEELDWKISNLENMIRLLETVRLASATRRRYLHSIRNTHPADEELVPILKKALQSPSEDVRDAVRIALSVFDAICRDAEDE